MQRRADVRQAVIDVVEPVLVGAFKIKELRAHIARFYGSELATLATEAELRGACAEAGADVGLILMMDVALRRPSREAMRRIAAKWNEGLPPPELPMIKRPNRPGPGGFEQDAAGFDLMQPPGSMRKTNGVHRLTVDPEVAIAHRDGGATGRRGTGSTSRRRRFPAYIARLREFLDRVNDLGAVNREIFEHIVDGRSLQWIADEMSMTKASVHKRVANARRLAGIAGPGSGR